MEEEEWREDRSLCDVEASPKRVFLKIATPGPVSDTDRPYGAGVLLLRTRRKRPVHRPDTDRQADPNHRPGIRRHEPIAPPALMQCARRDADDPESQPGVQKGLVQEAPLEWRHAPILSRFAVEEQVGADQGCADQSRADHELLSEAACVRPRRLVRLLDVVAAKSILKGGA